MIKRIIIFIESPYNKRDHHRFGIEILMQNGFEVEVWDFTFVMHPLLDLSPADPFEFKGLKIFQNKKEIVSSILKLTCTDIVIVWFHYSLNNLWIYSSLSKCHGSYATMYLAPSPHYNINKKLILKIQRLVKLVYSLIYFKNLWRTKLFVHAIVNRIFHCIPYKILGIRAAKFWFIGVESSLKAHVLPHDSNTKIVWIHAFDYDLFLEKKIRRANLFTNKAVFLDSYLAFHEDDDILKMPHAVSPERYYPSLCRFFDFVEREQNIKVEIAAHPRSHYENHPDYFGKRIIRRGQTIELVSDARFVIAHDSVSVNFAVLFYKPIIFIITNEMIQNTSAEVFFHFASLFGKKPINIDEQFAIDWDSELVVNRNYYENYKKTYIKKQGEDLRSWQIVANTINKYNKSIVKTISD